MSANLICPIWGTPVPSRYAYEGDGSVVDSPRADGKYFISGSAEVILGNEDDRLKARLTSWLVEQRRLGIACPKILSYTITDMKQRKDLRVSERANGILKYVDTRTETIGQEMDYRFVANLVETHLRPDDINYWNLLCYSESTKNEELLYLLDYLEDLGFIKISGRNNDLQGCILTINGYEKLAELEETHTVSSRAFVAMWFDASMDDAWERGINPAIREAGYDPIRIDQKEHANKIDDEIVAEIRRARFVIADFTHGDDGARGGVYYEAGFAQGLGIPVIFSCRESVFEDIHFDTRQYNHIVWKAPGELRDSLTRRIAAVIGDGPLKNDNAR